MNLSQFKDWATQQKSVAKYNDGQFLGECVSLVNQYCYRVLGIPAGAWGDAKDWATNPSSLKYFDIVKDLQHGDVLVYPTAGKYGHIEINLDNTNALGQNRHIDGKVHVDPIWTAYPYVILRKKGGFMNKDQAKQLALYIRLLAGNTVAKANAANEDDASHIVADPNYATGLAKQLYNGEWQPFAWRAGHYDEDVQKLKADAANGDGEAAKKLQAIKDALK